MPQIAEPITSLDQELEFRIKELEIRVGALWDAVEWLRSGLLKIANGRDDMNGIYIKQQAQSILDGEPTTADEYNTMQEDEKLVYEEEHKWNRDREEKINKEKAK